MKGSHIPLVVMSIVVLVVYVLPFTMLVLLGPWLQARSGYCLLRWVNKIKPLLDAYQGAKAGRGGLGMRLGVPTNTPAVENHSCVYN